MNSFVERWSGLGLQAQAPAFFVALGHGATHWIQATVYLLLPFITTELEISYVEAGLAITVFHASSFIANFGSGMIVDTLGRRVLIQCVSLVIGALALMTFNVVSYLWLLLIPVAVIGATNNLWHPAAISFLSGHFPKNRGYALSIHTLGASLGDTLAPLMIGVVLLSVSWQNAAVVSALPVFIVAAVLFIKLSHRDRDSAGQNDRGLSLSAYVNGLKTIFTNRSAMALCFMAGFRSMAQNGLLMFIPIYLANVLKVGPLLTGIGLFALQIGGFIAGPVAGAWSDKIGRRPVVVGGISGTTVIVFLLAFANNEIVFIAGVSVLGFFLFAIRPVIHSWMMDMTPPEMAGSATSALFGTQSALSMAIPVMGGFIADQYSVGAIFYVLAACMLIANALALMLPSKGAQ